MGILIGTRRGDTIVGGEGSDIVIAGRGHDTIEAGGGDDIVLAGNGHDTVDAGEGDDIVLAGNGRDTVDAGDGDDIVLAGNGHDTVDGGAGDDLILGGRGNDELRGGAGSDWLDGGRGSDRLVFNATDNVGAVDVYLGGRGRDTLVLELTAAQIVDGSLGAEIDAFGEIPRGSLFTFDTLGLTVHSVERLEVVEVGSPPPPPPPPPPPAGPEPEDDALAVMEEGTVTLDLTANDGGATFVEVVATSVTGLLTVDANGVATYEALGSDALAAGQVATETFTYRVEKDGQTATATATITITGTNDAPLLSGAVELPEIDEDTSIVLTTEQLVAGASDVDAGDEDRLAVTNVELADEASGTLTDNGDGTFAFVPAENTSGTVTLTYDVTDGTATVFQVASFEVVAVNDAVEVGTALADASSNEDAPVSVAIPAGAFTDADGDVPTLTATLADGSPLPAWLAFDGATFTGTPPANFNGDVALEVTATDGATSASQSFTLTIDPVNDPVLVGAPLGDVSSAEDAPVSFALPGDAFTDADGDALAFAAQVVDDEGDVGALPAWLAFDADARTFSGTPPRDFNGDLAIRVTATDGPTSEAQDFTLSVSPVNDAPTITVSNAITGADGSVGSFTDLGPATPGGLDRTRFQIDFDAADADGDDLTFAITQAPAFDETPAEASELDVSIDAATGTVTLDYSNDLNGEVVFEVGVSDGNGGTATLDRSVFSFDIIDGTAGDDVLEGTDRWERINGLEGDDTITGGEGENFLYGDAGNDTITGGGNNDELFGGAGNDTLAGGGFGDDLYGGTGADRLFGGAGNDDIFGGAGNDVIRAGRDNDDLYGEDGNDTLEGGQGSDDFHFDLGAGRTGTDTITDFTSGEDDVWLTGGGDIGAILATETAVTGGFRYEIGTEALVVNVALGTDDFVLA